MTTTATSYFAATSKSSKPANRHEHALAYDVAIIGGFGHVGLPLAIGLATAGLRVCAFDVDDHAGECIRRGKMPFTEIDGERQLREVLNDGSLSISLDRSNISQAEAVVIIVGTPVDRHLNPEFESMRTILQSYMDCLVDGQTVILRSTVFPGTTETLHRWLLKCGRKIHLAFCPERIAEGHALEELRSLPQIISGCSEAALQKAAALFGTLTNDLVILEPIEAELAKLFNNVWRYMQFATANQFFMIANDHKADFHRIRHAMTYKYPRAKGMPGSGFAAGPCLFKDTMQLAAFNNNNFYLGHAAMLVNEGLPNYIVNKLKQRFDLHDKTVGILGMAFKPNIDDPRESLSFKLRKILALECSEVCCSDAYVDAPDFVSTEELVRRSDIVILATPHSDYKTLRIPPPKITVDVWNFWERGGII